MEDRADAVDLEVGRRAEQVSQPFPGLAAVVAHGEEEVGGATEVLTHRVATDPADAEADGEAQGVAVQGDPAGADVPTAEEREPEDVAP